MKRKLILLLLVPLLVAQGIHFEDGISWQHVRQKAKGENKYIFVDCYATWCGPCKKMDKKVYGNESSKAFLNGKFVLAKVQNGSFCDDVDISSGDRHMKYRSGGKGAWDENSGAMLNGNCISSKVQVGDAGAERRLIWKPLRKRDVQTVYKEAITARLKNRELTRTHYVILWQGKRTWLT